LITDYKNLENLITNMLLNWRQAQWLEFFTRFDYQIVYWPGQSHGKADAFRRMPGDHSDGGEERLEHME
jgi:hypothetical protein